VGTASTDAGGGIADGAGGAPAAERMLDSISGLGSCGADIVPYALLQARRRKERVDAGGVTAYKQRKESLRLPVIDKPSETAAGLQGQSRRGWMGRYEGRWR
jgi:hypothetical protein